MAKIGTKHDQIFFNISKIIIYFWVIFSIIISIIINQNINFYNILMSMIIYANIFIPIYLVVFSIPLNKSYKYRLLKSLVALIPIIISYIILLNKNIFLNLNFIYLLIGSIIVFLLNFSLTINKKDYGLILLTLYFMLSSFLLNNINNSGIKDYLFVNRNNYDSLLKPGYILIVLSGILFAFINHLINLFIIERRMKCLK